METKYKISPNLYQTERFWDVWYDVIQYCDVMAIVTLNFLDPGCYTKRNILYILKY